MQRWRGLLVAAVVAAAAAGCLLGGCEGADAHGPIVRTRSGPLSGLQKETYIDKKTYYSFLGIPYAEPPVRETRFTAARAHGGWSAAAPRAARAHAPQCAQYYIPTRGPASYGHYGEEDCLYLDINTPSLDKDASLPTIVFLHNIQFKMSYNVSREYGPDLFMEEDVIIATVNHRLNYFGFMGLKDATTPGNNGLRDLILAIHWIKDNIEEFGGDPNKIILYGSSGGAIAVDLLIQTKKVKGLINGAILQSGSALNSVLLHDRLVKDTIELADIVGKKATSNPTLINNLKDVPAINITEAVFRVVHADDGRAIQRGILPFSPIVENRHDDAIITDLPENIIFDIDIPIMIGHNSREGLRFMDRYLRKPQFLTYADRDFLVLFPIRTDYHFKIHDQIYRKAEEEIKSFYFEEGYVKVSKPGEYATYLGDVMETYSIDRATRKYINESKAAVYPFEFGYSGELNWEKQQLLEAATSWEGADGATHGDELCYLFLCSGLRQRYRDPPASPHLRLARAMVKLWANFARTGEPTPAPGAAGQEVLGGLRWERARPEAGAALDAPLSWLQLGAPDEAVLEMRTAPRNPRYLFWDRFLDKYRALAHNGLVYDAKDEL